MSELSEVRRYWPKAKIVDVAIGHEVTYAVGDARAVVAVLPRRHSYVRGLYGRTLAEAMRAAGFGVRPEYATRGYHFAVWRAKKVSSRKQVRLWRAGCGWSPAWLIREYERFDRLPELVSTQRPRKGARLGKRKREALRRI